MEKAVVGKTKKYFYGKGGRKTATSQCRLFKAGKGEFTVNGRDYKDYFKTDSQKKSFLDAFVAVGHDKDVDASFRVQSGGLGGQADACRHALSRAFEQMDALLRPVLKAQGFMKRDPRVKERKKPGLKRARRAPQWSKR